MERSDVQYSKHTSVYNIEHPGQEAYPTDTPSQLLVDKPRSIDAIEWVSGQPPTEQPNRLHVNAMKYRYDASANLRNRTMNRLRTRRPTIGREAGPDLLKEYVPTYIFRVNLPKIGKFGP